jgi:hypothetical protein
LFLHHIITELPTYIVKPDIPTFNKNTALLTMQLFFLAASITSAQASDFPSSVQYPNTNDYVEVFISAVDNPGHFWVQLVRTGDAQKLDALITNITDEAMASEDDIVHSVEVGICSYLPDYIGGFIVT